MMIKADARLMGIGFRLATYALSCIEVTARWAVASKLVMYRGIAPTLGRARNTI
jgi:hypothetical protein